MTALVHELSADNPVRSGYQRLAYRAGTVLVVLGLAHVPLLAADGWNLVGPVSWRKPIVFGISLGLAAWSAGWVLGHLPRRRVPGWAVAGGLAAFSLLEWGLIALQRWRGVASHFNNATGFDAAVFSAMGAAVGALTLVYLGLLVWAAIGLRRPAAVRWAALTGLTLLLVASGLGSDLIARGTAAVAATGTVPDAVMIGAAGTGKLAHAVGLHGIQVLGVIAALLGIGTRTEAAASALMQRVSIAYVVGFGAVVAQVYAGRTLLDPASLWTVPIVLAAVVVGWCAVTALKDASLAVRATGRRRPVGVS